jgi:putative protease
MITKLPELIKSGVKSLKIEGRMKSEYYIATVVNAYRKAIDAIYNNETYDEYVEDVMKAANREVDLA